MHSFEIGANDAGQRLDKFLTKAVPALPVSLLYKSMRRKRIKLNGKRCEGAAKLHLGDVVELYLSDEFFTPPKYPFLAAGNDLHILYEDENLLLIDKPPGLVVHEDDSGEQDTLIHRIQRYLYEKGAFDPARENSFAPALCNRIDRNTGGIVMAAKNFEALQILSEKIKNRELGKFYLCLVQGVPSPSTAILRGWHVKNAADNMVSITPHRVPGAKSAVTAYTVLEQRGDHSLVEIELHTGRTHQIRAHMAAIGHPLLGDTKYGRNRTNRAYPYKFQALYAYKLIFRFTTDAGKLAYLNGQTFQVQAVPFLAEDKSAEKF